MSLKVVKCHNCQSVRDYSSKISHATEVGPGYEPSNSQSGAKCSRSCCSLILEEMGQSEWRKKRIKEVEEKT